MSEKREVKVAGIQLKTVPGKETHGYARKEDIVDNALQVLEQAGKEGVQIALLGELFFMEYDRFVQRDYDRFHPMFEIAETIPGPTINKISEIAKQYKMYIIAPIFEKAGPGVFYNSAPVIDPEGNVIGVSRKRHLPAVRSLEKLYFRPGIDFPVYTASWGKFGIGVCFDRRFPETARILALNGAEIYFNPIAGGPHITDAKRRGGIDTYEIIARMRAIDNAMYAVFVNRIGQEGEIQCFGDSIIIDPSGKIIASGEKFEEGKAVKNEVVSAVIDLENVNKSRIESGVFRDRRPEIYGRLVEMNLF